jgi:hypothetical protein
MRYEQIGCKKGKEKSVLKRNNNLIKFYPLQQQHQMRRTREGTRSLIDLMEKVIFPRGKGVDERKVVGWKVYFSNNFLFSETSNPRWECFHGFSE